MLALFFRQLAVLVGSGIPLVQAWQLLLSDMPGACRPSLHLAALQMEQGVCPSQAMRQSQAFPDLACRIIRAGEQTGTSKGSARSWPISMKGRAGSGASWSRPWLIRSSSWSVWQP